ncbi:alanyl-tRNA editing protein [Actinoplanes sp. NEAU-A12]|uniref:Alanyl-tRNA editing protein n=1 Tax=Actinoplanes sandaracinus TaxID=3045177 RepID=A0ABT6WLY7_9ACTN|nr:alanyl-tRNA editing protein [Actinoplanes sandaracinus]MDI6100747.1 alanyl-tRNA editing protein [Actinoplanes sandaracinus]
MTERLDWADPTVREWDCHVLWSDPADPEAGVVLDRSAFYPGGGGQPPDHGVLLWEGVRTRIVDTRKGDEHYLIPAPGDPVPAVGTLVRGALDDERRYSLMRTHSGLHILCGTVFRDFGALVTGGNMQPGEARMDFNLPEVPEGGFNGPWKQALEDAVNAEISADRKIVARVLPREEALAIPTLVRTQDALPPLDHPEIRVIDIVGLDRQGDGGTHVASTAQVGRIEVVKVESKGRQNRRVRIRIAD